METFSYNPKGQNRRNADKSCMIGFASLLLLLFSISLSHAQTATQTPFITTWNTDPGNSWGTRHIIFPGVGQNYTIFWTGRSGGRTIYGQLTGNNSTRIDFPAPGIYQVRVVPDKGTFHQFKMLDTETSKLLKVDQWGSIQWSSMASAFRSCTYMDVIATDIPNLSNVSDMSYMFSSCQSLIGNITFGSWNTGNVSNMSYMFAQATKFNQPIANWNTSRVSIMNRMFSGARSFNQPIGNWNTSKIVNMAGMFSEAISFNQPLAAWNTSNVTDMSYMFNGCYIFNQPLSNWNTSKVTNMAVMFGGAEAFNQPIGNWNTANVTNMMSMFSSAEVFNQSIGGWNTSKVTNISGMFYNAYAFNQPIGNWNTQNVTDMNALFGFTDSFNQPIGNWNTQNVTQMNIVFSHAKAFNQPIGNWNTSKVIRMDYMFYKAESFKQPVGNWNTSAVTNMEGMFGYASVFDQSLGTWNISNVTNMSGLLDYSGLSTDSYDQTLNGWVNRRPQNRVPLGAASLTYCNGTASRTLLRRLGWIISGDIKDCSNCTGCRQNASDAGINNLLGNVEMLTNETDSQSFAYPNPASDKLYLADQNATIKAFSITDLSGRVLLRKSKEHNNPITKEIYIGDFPSGTYIMNFHQKDGKLKTQKIRINK